MSEEDHTPEKPERHELPLMVSVAVMLFLYAVVFMMYWCWFVVPLGVRNISFRLWPCLRCLYNGPWFQFAALIVNNRSVLSSTAPIAAVLPDCAARTVTRRSLPLPIRAR